MTPSPICKLALVAALEREIAPLTRNWTRVEREHQGRKLTFFELDNMVAIAGGIGLDPARRAAEAIINLYHPAHLHSVGFAGALHAELRVGDIFSPAIVIDARDGSCIQLEAGNGTLVTFMAVAGAQQKAKLAEAYQAQAVDMEAASVAAAARSHGIPFGVTKVISDAVDFEMPAMANFINSDGQFETTRFAMFVALRPWLWQSVARLATHSREAAQALNSRLQRLAADLTATNSAPSSKLASATTPLRAGGRE